MTSPDLTAANIDKLAELFPSVITESLDAEGNPLRAVDFDLLRQELSDHIVEGPQERYQLNWPGKRAAAIAANAPIAKTLRPMREDSVNFDTTKNLFIEGDNLDALKLLQESYIGKVKLIYIDPPYNTGNDFIYEDDFAETSVDYLARSGQASETGDRLVANSEANGRFHSDWLSMMYSRLRLARNLLKDEGSIFVSINDVESAQLRKLLDEVFGPANFGAQLTVKTSGGRQDSKHFAVSQEYVLVYARSIAHFQAGRLPKEATGYTKIDPESGRMYKLQLLRKWGDNSLRSDRPNLYYSITDPDGNDCFPMADSSTEGCWRWGPGRMGEAIKSGLVEWSRASGSWTPYEKVFAPSDGEVLTKPFSTMVDVRGSGAGSIRALFDAKIFSYPKSVDLIELLMRMADVHGDDVVLDFFAGSSTTAHAVISQNAQDAGNRRFIMVQLDESVGADSIAAQEYGTISSISRERIRRAGSSLVDSGGVAVGGLDIGFRTFRIDTTNMAHTFTTADDLKQLELTEAISSVKRDRTDEDLLFQVLLDWGLDLAESVSVEEVGGRRVMSVAGGAVIACFAEEVTDDVVKQIAGRRPLRAVFLDAGFADDAARINAEQVFRESSPETEVRTI